MRSTTTITALAALLAFSAAQSLSEVPECAQSCFMDGVSASGCGLLDAYCQCTEGAEALRATTIGCLCKSECTATDLMKVQQISNGICSSAVAASGETYQATSVGMEVCQATPNAGSGTRTAASNEANATGDSESTEASASASAGADQQTDNAAAPAVTGMAGLSVMGAVALGLVAL